jgi:hypothetical protein
LGAVGPGAGAAAVDADVTDWLAAIAAAAIASGAVAGPDVAGAVGVVATAAKAAGTAMAVTTGFGSGISVASGEVAALAGSATAEASGDDEVAVDFAPSAWAPADFPGRCDGASVGAAPTPVAEGGAALASWLLMTESVLADWPAGVALRELLSGAVELLLSDRRGGADWAWAGAGPASFAALPPIRDPKMALPCDGSEDGLAGRGEGPWKDMLVAASDATLCTGGLWRWNLLTDQQGPGHPKRFVKSMYFNGLSFQPADGARAWNHPFLPAGKICRLPPAKQVRVIASQEGGLY